MVLVYRSRTFTQAVLGLLEIYMYVRQNTAQGTKYSFCENN